MVHLAFRPLDLVAQLLLFFGVFFAPRADTGIMGAIADDTCDVLLIGQSNALHLDPALRAALPQCTVHTYATGGAYLDWVLGHDLPRAVSELRGLRVVPDAVVLVHGESDARERATAERYEARVFGASRSSLVGRLRTEWPGVPLVVVELRVTDERYGAAIPLVRAALHHGCAWTEGCALVPSLDAELGADGLHLAPSGARTVARRVAEAVETWP